VSLAVSFLDLEVKGTILTGVQRGLERVKANNATLAEYSIASLSVHTDDNIGHRLKHQYSVGIRVFQSTPIIVIRLYAK
jgi:hypothetical protein